MCLTNPILVIVSSKTFPSLQCSIVLPICLSLDLVFFNSDELKFCLICLDFPYEFEFVDALTSL